MNDNLVLSVSRDMNEYPTNSGGDKGREAGDEVGPDGPNVSGNVQAYDASGDVAA